MTRDDWLELTVLERKKYNYLTEVQDVTRQLAESLDRNDQVSARMLIAMRQDPIRQLAEVDNSEKLRLGTFSEANRDRVKALCQGEPPREDGERIFSEQAGKPAACWSRWWNWTAGPACGWLESSPTITSKEP